MNSTDLAELRTRLDQLRAEIHQAGLASPAVSLVHPENLASATNLLHYLSLRSFELRDLQHDLSRLGLSSLGRCEAHVLATLDLVRSAIARMAGGPGLDLAEIQAEHDAGEVRLAAQNDALFGPRRFGRSTRVMVTLPTQAADDPDFISQCAHRGSALCRINTAHDDESVWATMIERIRALPADASARVFMDLAGPKLRTGPIADGPEVVRLRPQRDARGRVIQPVQVRLGQASEPGTVPIDDAGWLGRRSVGEVVRLRDARGSSREMTVVAVDAAAITCELLDTAYLISGTALSVQTERTVIGRLPPIAGRLRLVPGDELILDAAAEPADPHAQPLRIGCSLPEVLDQVQVGQRVYFDDGKIGGQVIDARPGELRIVITEIAESGAWLRAEKGINLPDSDLDLPGLTDDDRAVLPFIVQHADAVALSFVNSAADVAELRAELARLGAPDFPFVIKIETARGFSNLPEILLEALRSPRVGVMIARGDLAVEVGYTRLAELQEEIMWLCEAAHVPVIWATQVLESLANTGRPSRAEVTDAALAVRAECVMLNKGPYIVEAVAFLDDLLLRMSDHVDKKSSLLRRLRLRADVD